MYIKYKTAELANKKGWKAGKKAINPIGSTVSLKQADLYSDIFHVCPQSQLQDWLRDTHGIHIIVEPMMSLGRGSKILTVAGYGGRVITLKDISGSRRGDIGDTYHECLEKMLIEALNLIP